MTPYKLTAGFVWNI